MRNIGRRLSRKISRLIEKGALNSGDVVLRWRGVVDPPEDFDPHLQTSKSGTTYPELTATKKAFIHYVNIHTTGYTKFTEIQTGDVILDFPGDVEIDGLENLQFEIADASGGSKIYVQKNGGKELAESWDVRCNGLAITRTVLVTLKS
jgi:hypothetical protein